MIPLNAVIGGWLCRFNRDRRTIAEHGAAELSGAELGAAERGAAEQLYAPVAYRSLKGYACQAIRQSLMQLCRPFSLRLSPELLRWLDSWRGDRMSRGTAIRLLLQQAMEQQGQP